MQNAADLVAGKASRRDVYITESLAQRPSGPLDCGAEKDAILGLSLAMAEHPADVLPRFVELAMELIGGTSAGLSLYEGEPSPGVFRWRCLHGDFACFENGLTPRHDSPCGITLDQKRPVLATHPERIYDWIAQSGIVVPEVLLVPLYIGSDEPLGTLWVVAPEEGHFRPDHARIAQELAGFAGNALKLIRKSERLRSALDEQELLAREMSHRLHNLFAMADAMIRGTARDVDNVEEMADTLTGRLHALAEAHCLVAFTAGSHPDGERAIDLASLISAVVSVHDAARDTDGSRVTIEGPHVACGDRAINAVALVVHELATNAVKYGALGQDAGHVRIHWSLEDGRLELWWTERGGPPIHRVPERRGFGTTLIARTVERQLKGHVACDWAEEGLTVHLSLDAERLAS